MVTLSLKCDIDDISDVEDGELVDIVFGGDDLDFAYILSKKSLYKLTGKL